MRRPVSFSIRPAFAAILLGGTAIAGIGGGVAWADSSGASGGGQVQAPAVAAVQRAGVHASLADMVQAVGPAVVQIDVTSHPQVQEMDDSDDGNPFAQFFGMQGMQQGPAPEERALGSGFIINPSGIVITNNHVVAGADTVKVVLSDGRSYPGRVLGTDPKTDVAVGRIEGKGPFPTVQWGDSDHLRVGDSVFAVGSPFGLGNTVTAGILSARGREIDDGPYDNFLQVDAAINKGNSGGPLFNASGKVVGVNTAIYSPSGGNVGIGFAIPSQEVRDVAQQIIEHGHVTRGRIGVTLQDLTPELANEFGLDDTKGALIAAVAQDGPAAAAGIERGDIVERFDGQKVDNGRDLARDVADAKIGSHVPVTVLRDGHDVQLALGIERDNPMQSS